MGWLRDYCRSAPQVDGCHWRLVGECFTLSVRKLIMAPRYSDPGSVQRSRHTSLPRSGAMDRGYQLLCWTLNIWNCDGWDWYIKTLSKPAWTGTGEVLPWKCGEFLLDFILVLSNESKLFEVVRDLWYHNFEVEHRSLRSLACLGEYWCQNHLDISL